MPEIRDLIVIGGGEHARVIIDAALTRPDLWRVLGFMDMKECAETSERFGLRRLGSDSDVAAITREHPDAFFVVGIGAVGTSALRIRIVDNYSAAGVRWATVIHRDATVAATATVGEGTVVFARAAVNTGAAIGKHCVVNTGAIVEHDVVLGDFAQAGPGAAIGGGAAIGEGAYLGLGSRVRDHIRVGRSALVAMGAAVVENVPDSVHVMGVPARQKAS